MTIIAYRDGILAADGNCSSSDTITGQCVKIARNKRGDLAGATGDLVYNYVFLQWFLNGEKKKPPDASSPGEASRSNRGLIVRRGGVIEIFEFGGKHRLEPDYYAMGSGRDIALGPLYAGASAVEAVEAAVHHDAACGGKMTVLKHKAK